MPNLQVACLFYPPAPLFVFPTPQSSLSTSPALLPNVRAHTKKREQSTERLHTFANLFYAVISCLPSFLYINASAKMPLFLPHGHHLWSGGFPCHVALRHSQLFCKNNQPHHFYSLGCSFSINYTSPHKMLFALRRAPGSYCWHRQQPVMLTNAIMISKTLIGTA